MQMRDTRDQLETIDVTRLMLLVAAVVCAFAGQYAFASGRPHYRRALVFYSIAVVVMWSYAWLESRIRAEVPGDPTSSSSPTHRLSVVQALSAQIEDETMAWRSVFGILSLLSLAFCLSLWLMDIQYGLQVALWLTSMTLFVATCWPYGVYTVGVTAWRQWLSDHWRQVMVVGIIVILSFALRAYALDRFPAGFHGDEGEWGTYALAILEGEQTPPFSTGWDRHPTLFSHLQALSMDLFGMDVSGIRLLSAITGAFQVLATYWLVRTMLGPWTAVVASSLLMAAPWHLQFSRMAMNDVQVSLFTTLVVYFLYKGVESGRAVHYSLGGLCLGLAYYFGNKAQLLPPLVVGVLVYLTIFQRGFLRRQYINIIILLMGAVIAFAPLGLYYSQHDWRIMLFSRTQDRFVFNHLDRFQAAHGTANLWDVLRFQVERSMLVFNYYPDAGGFMSFTHEPLLGFYTAALYVLGLAYAVYRWRQAKYGLLLIWYAVTLQGTLLSIHPPQTHRIVGMMPVPFILAAVTVLLVGREFVRLAIWRRPVHAAVPLIFFLGMVGYLNTYSYFVRYADQQPWVNVTEPARYIRDLGEDYKVYFLGRPYLYFGHGTIRFIAHGISGEDVADVTDVVPIREDLNKNVAFLLMPGNEEALPFIEKVYPDGRLHEEVGTDGRRLFLAYLVSEEEIASTGRR